MYSHSKLSGFRMSFGGRLVGRVSESKSEISYLPVAGWINSYFISLIQVKTVMQFMRMNWFFNTI